MEYHVIEYPNGIRAVLKRTKSPVVYSALTIGAGSGDELPGEEGIAHFIEHMFFKGTLHRKQYHINSLLDNVGGELNAYTTKEETVIHSTVLKCDFAKAVDLIHDVAFHSIFDNKEIDKECTVILDEINSYKDSPSEQIFDDFEDLVFSGSSLGHPILGSKRSLATFNGDRLRSFIDRCYNSDKIVFSVIGNVTFDRFKSTMDKYFSEIVSNPRGWSRTELSDYAPKNVEVARKTHQCHLILGNRAYNHFDNKRVSLALLTNLLAGQSPSSILNQVLREKNGLTYNVESGYTSFEKSGLFTLYLSCDSDKRERCLELTMRELAKIRTEPLSVHNITRYKKQLIGQIAVSGDNNESLMLASARSLLVYNEIDSFEQIQKRIESITASDIMDVANEIFDESLISTLIYKR